MIKSVKFYGIPCLMDIDTGDVVGKNSFYDLLIPLAAWIHNFFSFLVPASGNDGFPFKVIEDKPDSSFPPVKNAPPKPRIPEPPKPPEKPKTIRYETSWRGLK